VSAPKKIRYHLNVRAVLILAAIGLTASLGLYVLWGYQQKQILDFALEEQIKKFQKAADEADKLSDQDQKSRNNDLALRHLTQYLDARPDDPDALDIEAKLLLEARNALGAANAYEHLIRVEGLEPLAAGGKAPAGQKHAPVSSRVQTARRRLAEIYIAISDYRRNDRFAKLEPEKAGQSYQYHVAELHAKNLLGLVEKDPSQPFSEDAHAQPFSEDAHAHLLYALALEGQIVPGQTSRDRVALVAVQGEKENEGWEVGVEDGAILEYENALALNAPVLKDKKALERMDKKDRDEHMRDDIVAAMRLAGLYQKASRKTTEISKQLKPLIDAHKPIETDPGANRPDGAGPKPKNSAVDNEKTFVDFLRAHSAARRLADLYQGSRKNGFDLRLMSSVSGVSDIPTAGNNQVIIAKVGDVLHFRIFEDDGRNVVDTDETRLTAQAGPIADLKKQLENLWPPHQLGEGEKDQVIAAVTSIVRHTRKNIEIAKEVLDRLLDVHDSVDVRTARYAFFNSIGEPRNATAELEQAILLDPENLVLILTATENAMRSASAGMVEPHFWLDQVPRSWHDGFDLQLMSSVNDVNRIPTTGGPTRSAGKSLIILAVVNQVLHFRMFDGDGKMVVDTDEKRLTDEARQDEKRLAEQVRQIEELRRQLESLWPRDELDEDEKVRVINAVTSIVRHTPRDDPRVLMVQGLVQYAEQKYEDALATWRNGLKANPSALGFSQRLALVLLELGRDEEAAKIIEQYRRQVDRKSDPVLQFLEAIQDEHAGRFSRAIETLELARGRLPESFQTQVHLILARCQEKQGDSLAAANTCRTALGLDPKSLALRHFLGRLLLATQPEEAAREFEQGLKLSPNQPAFLVGLVEARLLQQKALPQGRRNWSDIDAVLERAAGVMPSSIVPALLKAERLAAGGQVDQAILSLKAEVEKNPKSPELAARLADYHRGQGQADEALKVLTRASDPSAAGDRGLLRVQRAMVLTSQGDQGREARNVLLRDVNQLAPADRDEVWTYLFLLCKSQGNPETTRAIYNEWSRLLPDDPRPKFALLDMDIEANNQEAIGDRLKSLTPHNDQGDFMYRLVQARQRLMEAKKLPAEKEQERKEKLKVAGDLVEQVLHEFKIDTVALLLKGQILEAEGSAEKAADFYKQAWARGNVDALVRLVDLWARLGRRPELDRLRQNDKTRQLDPIVATAYLSHGAWNEAARIARQSLAEDPGKPSWQVGVLDYLGKNEEAETSLWTLAEQRPDKLEPWLALARFHATQHRARTATDSDRRHKVEEILEEIKPLLKLPWPELIEAECRFAAADWPAADKAFDAARKLYPETAEVQEAATRYAAQKGRLDAAEARLSYLKAEGNIARFKPLLKAGWPDELLAAECHFAAADWPAANKAFDAALKRYPQLPEVQAAEARYRTQKGRPGAAEASLKWLEAEAAIAAEIEPRLKNRWPAELLAAECRFAAADWPAADKAFDEARKRYPEATEVQEAATRYQAQKGRPDAAEACLRRLKIEATIAEAKQRVKLSWPELIEAECRRAAADWPAADKAFDEAAKRYHDVRDVQLAAARYYEERGRLDVAEACLRRMLKRNPDERGAALELAIVLSNQGAWKQALELLGPDPEGTKTKRPEERLARAIVLGHSRELPRMEQAIDMLQALLADIPAESSLASTSREMLTRFLLASGKADQASRVAGSASARGRTPTAIALHAEALLQNRQFDAAEDQKRQLEQIDPENPNLANFRARLILGRSKPAEAAAALEKAYLDLAKESGSHAEKFGREVFPIILGLGPNAQGTAEELATHLAKHNPALSWMTASILASRGKRAEALVLCRTAVEAVEAGKSLTDLQRACRIVLEVVIASGSETTALNQAEEILAAALKRMPEADDLLVMKAMIHHFQSRFDEESRLYRDVLSRKPQSPLALNNIAWVLSEGLHQPDEALEKIDEVIKLTDRNPNNVDTRGVILVRLGRFEQAIDELKWVVQAEPTAVHYYHLAQAYRKMGRDADFHKAFEEAKRAGLNAAVLDPVERADFEDMLKL
jgi:tetratricopeptide (TPR) repeat protein